MADKFVNVRIKTQTHQTAVKLADKQGVKLWRLFELAVQLLKDNR